MSKTLIAALATATILAGTSFTSSAEAGVRLGFGFPLGAFVAHRHQSYNGPSSYERRCAERRARRARVAKIRAARAAKLRAAQAAKIREAKAKKIAAAKAAARAEAQRKAQVAEAARKAQNKVDLAAVKDTTPAIYVPGKPEVKGTQSTSAVQTASIDNTASQPKVTPSADVQPTIVSAEPVAEEIKTEKPNTIETVKTAATSRISNVKIPVKAKQICRRFSALIGDLIDVPCK